MTDLSSPQPCPECRDGKCRNCAGWSLDETTDQITDCACERAGHQERA